MIALDLDKDALADLKSTHPSVTTIHADLSDWEKSREAVLALPTGPIHHLVNNAGISEVVEFSKITPKNVDTIFGINYKALINMGQVMAKTLEQGGVTTGGTIVNVSSIVSHAFVKCAFVVGIARARHFLNLQNQCLWTVYKRDSTFHLKIQFQTFKIST